MEIRQYGGTKFRYPTLARSRLALLYDGNDSRHAESAFSRYFLTCLTSASGDAISFCHYFMPPSEVCLANQMYQILEEASSND